MASSGSFTTSSRGATQYPRNATFNWWQTGQSVDGNYTTIDWNFVLGGGSSNTASIAIYSGSITVNGTTTNFNYGGAYKKNGFVLASGSATIYHNEDGTKAFNANGGVNIYGSSQWYGGSQDFWLNTIARASTPSLTNANFNIGDTITINTNRASSSFTHTVKIKYGSSTTTIATGVGASVTYDTSNIADALYALIPNAKKYTGGTIEVTTYNGGTVIGTKSCAYIANAVASAASPLFSDFAYADTNSATTSVTGDSTVLISGKSSLAVTISAANKAEPQKSASMTKYTYQIAGLTGEENYSTSQIVKNMGAPEVAPTELPSGIRDLVVTAVDSRGYSTAVTKRVTIVPYKAPAISASAARRNGFEAETTIKIAGTFSRIEVGGTAKNTVNASSGVKYRYKLQSSTTWGSWTSKTATVDTSAGTVSVADFQINLDNGQAYDIEIQITDKLQTTIASLVVSAGQPAFWIGADGRVSVGGMPTQEKLSGEKGILEVHGRAFSAGSPILTEAYGKMKLLDTIDASTIPHTDGYGLGLDIKKYFADMSTAANRPMVYDRLLFKLNIGLEDQNNIHYLRFGTNVSGQTNIVTRTMLTLGANGTVTCQTTDVSNSILGIMRGTNSTIYVDPWGGVNLTPTLADDLNFVTLTDNSSVAFGQDAPRLNVSTLYRLYRSNGVMYAYFSAGENTGAVTGNIKIYGIKYATGA